MSEIQRESASAGGPAAGVGATLFTFGGLAAAFGVASCCALPLALAGIGVGSAWLGGLALAASPHRDGLELVSALGLVGGAALFVRQERTLTSCRIDGVCATPASRGLTVAGLLAGAVLLVVGHLYV